MRGKFIPKPAAASRKAAPATRLHPGAPVGLPLFLGTRAAEAEADRFADRALSSASPVPADVGGGRLAPAHRASLEAAAGMALDHVRVHTGPGAEAAAHDLRALAFTTGSDIFFAAGKYRPGTSAGFKLLAHEIAHVAQQSGRPAMARRQEDVAAPPEASLADRAIAHVAQQSGGPAMAQRQEDVTAPPEASLADRVIAHVAQQSGGPAMVQRQEDVTAPPEASLADLMRPAVRQVVRQSVGGEADFASALAAAATAALADEISAEERGTVSAAAVAVAGITAQADGQTLDIPRALSNLALAYSGAEPGLGLDYLIGVMAGDIAKYLAASLEGSLGAINLWHLTIGNDIWVAVDAARNGRDLMRLELEAAVHRLIELRGKFNRSFDPRERVRLGPALGQVSRQALLLNGRLAALERTASGATPLDVAVSRSAVDIAAIRTAAQSERTTVEQLGDSPELLAVQTLTLPEQKFSEQFEMPEGTTAVTAEVRPEEALPETLDTAISGLQNELERRTRRQQEGIQQLREAVIPSSPRYDLAEFNGVFRRWFAFFSQERENRNSIVRLWKGMLGDVYPMAGMGGLGPLTAVEGGVARAWFMNFAAAELESQMEGTSGEFAWQVRQARPRRAPVPVGGTATSPAYEYGELYPVGGFRPGEAAERSSREEMARLRQTATAALRTPEFAGLTPPAQHQVAASLGVVAPPTDAAPIVGLQSPAGRDDWSYLVNVYEWPGEDRVVARELKAMPPEVARYLLARRQQAGALSDPHRPMAGGRPIGDREMRAGGLEASEAANVARYTEGELAPRMASSAARLRETLRSARREAGLPEATRDLRGDPSELVTGRLIDDLERYLEQFFRARQEPEYRFAAILVIANVEHGIGAKLMALLTPEHIAKLLTEGLALGFGLSFLRSRGPLGQILAKGAETYMATRMTDPIAAIIGVAAFIRNARAANLAQARIWAYMSTYVASDLEQLFDLVVMAPAASAGHKAFEALARTRPSTARQMAEVCEPLLLEPASRRAIIEGLDTRIAELETAGAGRQSHPEYESLVAFRRMVKPYEAGTGGRSEVDPAADRPLPGMQGETRETQYFAGGRPRTLQERAVLLEAIPADLRGGVTPVENPALPSNSVVVRFEGGVLRMEYGPGATRREIRAHVMVLRQLRRYQGTASLVRRLIDSVLSFLRIRPGIGTRGGEARLEVEKLNAILADLRAMQARVDARAARLSQDPAQARRFSESEEIAREIENIEQQLREHRGFVDSYEPGRGFVAAMGRDTPRSDALLRQIAGNREMYSAILAEMRDLSAQIPERVGAQRAAPTRESAEALRATRAELRELGAEAARYESRQAALEEALRVSRLSLYDKIRAAAPSPAAAEAALKRAAGMDEVSGQPSGNLQVDHLVPIREIVQMRGFDEIGWQNQKAIVDMRENLVAMDGSANGSKGARSWSEWTQWANYYRDPRIRTRMMAREAIARARIEAEISRLRSGR